MVQRPKSKDGLCVINLGIQNDALVTKHLNKFYNKESILWVDLVWEKYYVHGNLIQERYKTSFWWKVYRLSILYKGFARATPGDGSTIFLWNDIWTSQ